MAANLRLVRGSKYRAVATSYNGRRYHSGREARHAFELDLRKGAGEIVDWTPQVPFTLSVNDRVICTYIADFLVVERRPDGSARCVIEEVKGVETSTWKVKKRLFEALHPDTELRVIH